MAPGLASTLALLSGIPLVALGLALLALRPRTSGQTFFGLFAILWGVQIVAANVGVVLDSPRVFRVAFLVSFAVAPAAYLFLAQFTARVHAGRRSWILPASLAVLAFVAMLVLVVWPETVVASVGTAPDGGLGAVEQGPAAFPLFVIPFFGVFYLALGAVYGRYRQADPGSVRHQFRGMLIALALYTSYQTTTNLFTFLTGGIPTSVAGEIGALLAPALFLVGALFLVAIVLHLAVRPTDPGDRDWTLLGAFLVPAAVALVTELWGAIPPTARTWGLWRLLMVAVLVHSIARYRLFDLDLKLKRWAGPGIATGVLLVAVVVALVQAGASDQTRLWAQPLFAGTLTAGLLVFERDRVGRMLFPAAREETGYVEQRKLEVYRAALEAVLSEGEDPDEDPVLADLRARMTLSQRAHERMVAQMREPGSVADEGLPAIEPGARLVDRYRVERLIGEGGHGRAFLAWDEAEERQVVLKVVGKPVLGGEAVQALLREAEIMSGIDHSNVLEVHEVLEGRHELVLVSEYASKGSLADLLARRGRLGVARSVEIVDQVLQGLQAAHEQGVVHRDVKPENVLLAEDGVRVADFGVAERGSEGGSTIAAGPVGTLLYMSPEQVRGAQVDERSDLYAVGVVLHRVLTGGFYLPTSGADDFVIRRRILEEAPQLELDGEAARLEGLLERALAKDPDDRFASAAEMREALDQALGAEPPAAKPV